MNKAKKIAVIGAGLGGASMGLLLQRAGLMLMSMNKQQNFLV